MQARLSLASRAAISLGGSALYLGLSILAMGGWQAYFSHPPLTALAVVFLALSAAALVGGRKCQSGRPRGSRQSVGDRRHYRDRMGFCTIDGDAIRWFGVALVAVGGALRIAPVFILGDRFSGLVAIQPIHTLVTTGLYGAIRHPSYLGLLISSIGWGLAFRSVLGVLLALLLLPPLIARIESEEALLQSHFGAEYEAYRAKSSRLIPRLY